MPADSQRQSNSIEVGNDAGWVLEFYRVDFDGRITDDPTLSVSSSDYYASIDAHLQDGLQGGAYAITIEGLVDSDYQVISPSQQNPPAVAKLYLFWNDTVSGPLSYLGNLADLSRGPSQGALAKALVSVLHVNEVKREVGASTYDTEIHAVDWAFWMMRQPLRSPLRQDFYRSVCLDIYERTQIPVNTFPDSGRLTRDTAGTQSTEKVNYQTGKTYGAILTEIARAVETNLDQHGHQMLLIRDGQIYLGPRPFPLDGAIKPLTVATGLVHSPADGSSDTDPTAPDISGKRHRSEFTLTLKGRPDIKPGDVVAFDPAPEDESTLPGFGSALAGGFAGPLVPPDAGMTLTEKKVTLAVTSVKHRLGRTTGFMTEVKGVELKEPTNPWVTYAENGVSPKQQPPSPTADAAGTAAAAIKEQLEDWTTNRRYLDIGQVRAFNSATAGADSPSQIESAWEGLREVDQNPNGTRRLPIDRDNAVRTDIPYTTPFAWGKCGLVLPRYPGMRIALGHRHARDNEALDMGAIWESGTGPDSHPGDWWLSLPVGVPESERANAADSDDPLPWSGPVTQDLIDAEGNRSIELGSLVVRVGRNQLHSAGSRPAPASEAGSITIEHQSGESSIVMKQDGSIVIKGKTITIDAGAGDITMKANKVDVQVASTMDVR